MKATYRLIDQNRRLHTFELFGYDFMIDESLKVYLIEANINPCLSVTSTFSSKFIPVLVDNTVRMALDPLFPPPPDFVSCKKTTSDLLPELRFELIFDQQIEESALSVLYKGQSLDPYCNSFLLMEIIGQRDGDEKSECSEDQGEDEPN